ncbi:MAG TPA: relaxase MobL [Pyrinomonadaceae bacterium]
MTRYIAEREKDLAREGPGARPLFSEDREGLTYRKADWILDPYEGLPEKRDLIHFSVTVTEEDFDKLGDDEKQKQARLREVIREGMEGMASELNVEQLVWVAGIHHHSEHPHAHVVIHKNVLEAGTERPGRIARLPKHLLPHKDTRDGRDVIVNGPIGEQFVKALERQQSIHRNKEKQPALTPAEKWERLARKYQQEPVRRRGAEAADRSRTDSLSLRQVARTWNSDAETPDDRTNDFRLALGKRLTLEFRLGFAEAWHDRAIRHGTTYRFEVMDQSSGEERKISDLDVRRRASARGARLSDGDHSRRNEEVDRDLNKHTDTLKQLAQARETKIAALEKDINSLRGNLGKVERNLQKHHHIPAGQRLTPLISRETISELQEQAVKLNLSDRVAELERIRIELAHEHQAPTRTDTEAASLAAQVNVTRADFMAKNVRLENFEASVHVTSYEVRDERWSLAELDKQIARRREDTKFIPHRAARLDLRSLARLNYSAAAREEAAADVQHLLFVRDEIVRKIDERRAPLVAERELARDMVDVLQSAYTSEQRQRMGNGLSMPEAKYERHQILSLEASAEVLQDVKLLRDVHEWEKNDREINWEGRATAREITSEIAVEVRRERLEHFLESKKVASLHLGEHRTGTLREVEARTLTEYVARALTESQEQRQYRHDVKTTARTHETRLVSDLERADQYHQAARELASEAKERNPQFTDKEKINLEIYAERQNDESEREKYLELARGSAQSQDRELSVSLAR